MVETTPRMTSDLITSLDAEPLFDYLIQNGVLDSQSANEIREVDSPEERNQRLVHHLDSHGNVAIGLFINALRLSGQLQLASSLDVTNRILPVYGIGYWQKTRHKGQVVIEICVSAVRTYVSKSVNAHRWLSMEDVRIALSPSRRPLNKSYENMTIFENPRDHQAIYDSSDDNRSSCCCFRRRKPRVKQNRSVRSSNRSLGYSNSLKEHSGTRLKEHNGSLKDHTGLKDVNSTPNKKLVLTPEKILNDKNGFGKNIPMKDNVSKSDLDLVINTKFHSQRGGSDSKLGQNYKSGQYSNRYPDLKVDSKKGFDVKNGCERTNSLRENVDQLKLELLTKRRLELQNCTPVKIGGPKKNSDDNINNRDTSLKAKSEDILAGGCIDKTGFTSVPNTPWKGSSDYRNQHGNTPSDQNVNNNSSSQILHSLPEISSKTVVYDTPGSLINGFHDAKSSVKNDTKSMPNTPLKTIKLRTGQISGVQNGHCETNAIKEPPAQHIKRSYVSDSKIIGHFQNGYSEDDSAKLGTTHGSDNTIGTNNYRDDQVAFRNSQNLDNSMSYGANTICHATDKYSSDDCIKNSDKIPKSHDQMSLNYGKVIRLPKSISMSPTHKISDTAALLDSSGDNSSSTSFVSASSVNKNNSNANVENVESISHDGINDKHAKNLSAYINENSTISTDVNRMDKHTNNENDAYVDKNTNNKHNIDQTTNNENNHTAERMINYNKMGNNTNNDKNDTRTRNIKNDNRFDKNTKYENNDDVYKNNENTPLITEPIDGILEWISTLDILKEKEQKFISLFTDENSLYYQKLLKFFEQTRGNLFLEITSTDSLNVTVICMSKEQVTKLKTDLGNETLQEQIQMLLVDDNLLKVLNVTDVLLEVSVSDNDFYMVEKEYAM